MRFWIAFSLLFFVQALDPFADRPRITVENGHLVIQSSAHHNITFKSTGRGRINVNDADIGKLIETVQSSVSEMEQFKTLDLGSMESKIQQLQDHVDGMSNLAHLYTILNERIENLTSQVNQMSGGRGDRIGRFGGSIPRRVRKLERDIRELQRNLDRNECESNPCQNGGTCMDTYNGFNCRCPTNWMGPVCANDVNECAIFIGTDLGCQNGATCYNHDGGYRCQCSANWYGVHCTEQFDDCLQANEDALCGHGRCVNRPRAQQGQPKFNCTCDQGWTKRIGSVVCDVDVDECIGQSYPCSVNPYVQCINSPGSFRCSQCPAGYSGDGHRCSDINECEVNNGGCSLSPRVDCLNTLGSRICGPCPPGYVGEGTQCVYLGTCQTRNGGCHPLATCIENPASGQGSRECRCPSGYVGNGIGPSGCQAQTGNACSPNPCLHGACTVSNSNAQCFCYAGYTGARCELEVNDCASNPCQNGGSCQDRPGDFFCICTSTWRGRTCEEPADTCGGHLDGLSGYINYPSSGIDTYAHKQDCAWVITTTPGKVLNLTFERFHLEHSEHCTFDFLQIHDGSNAGASILGRYCTTLPGQDGLLITTHNQVYLWFHSDSDVSGSGFKVRWNTSDPVCGGVIPEQEYGSFDSPGYPGHYPANRDCYWTVQVPLGKRIQFQFATLHMEQHPNCSFDFLQIRDGQREVDPVLKTYCTSETPGPLQTSGPYAWIHFHTDPSINDQGFHITYAAVPGAPGCGGLLTRDRGTIVSPNFPDSYQNAMVCDWLIRIHPQEKIRLEFEVFQLEHHSDCQWDYIQIHDGEDENALLKGRYCGGNFPPVIISSSNTLWIQFRSDISNQDKGFKASYTTACGGMYTGTQGEISSPYYPDPYPSETTCHYEIVVPQGNIVHLQFSDLSLKEQDSENPDCINNYLQIRDSGSPNGTLLAKFCGSGQPEPIFSSYNRILLTLVSDGSIQNRGFKANFSAVDVGCGGVLTEPRGSFSSPRNPLEYPPGQTCNWVIRAELGSVVRLHFTSFALEDHPQCQYDYVELRDGDGQFSKRFCGTRIPQTIVSTGRDLIVSFVSDQSTSREGFEATYSFLNGTQHCGGSLVSDYGFVRSPRYPQNYPPMKDCTWVLHADTGHRIRLNVTHFEIEEHQHCNFDFLEIRNGGFASSPLLGKFCGDTIPREIVSHSNLLFIHFHSDHSLSGPGFEIEYDAQLAGCGGLLTSPSGSIVSPHYPEPYSHSSECTWTVRVSEGSIISFVVVDIDIEAHSDCTFDYLAIYDGPNDSSRKVLELCTGKQNPGAINSTGNALFIKFVTDSSKSGRGFYFSYHTVCNTIIQGIKGAISSPNFPGFYPHNYNCTWSIRAPLGNNVSLSFSHLILEDDDECKHDYVEVIKEHRPGYAETEFTSLMKYCGNNSTLPPPLVINSNKVLVRFISDGSVASDGFRLEYRALGCGDEIRKTYGTLTSPNYPNGYPVLTTCEWTIISEPGKNIVFNINDIEMEGVADCKFDYVKVYAGSDRNGVLLLTACNRGEVGHRVTSSDNRLFVVFHSDVTLTRKGFRANFHSVQGCGGSLTGQKGALVSPNYPGSFGNSISCTWFVKVNRDHLVQLTIDELWLPEHQDDNCTSNYLKIMDFDGTYSPYMRPRIGGSSQDKSKVSYCSNSNPAGNTYLSSTSGVLITMQISPTDQVTKPFKISYAQVCGATIDVNDGGQLTSPGYPQQEYHHYNCTWILRNTNPEGHLTISFTNMVVAHSDNCTESFLELRAGENSDSPLVNRYCGTRLPAPVTSYGNAFHLFMQDMAIFRLTYSSSLSACGGELYAMEGTINSPGFPDSYPPNMECTWTIRSAPGNKIQLNFKFFNLEDSDYCSTDFLEIRASGSDGRLLDRVCGTTVHNVNLEDEVIWMLFRSDDEGTAPGFQADFVLEHGVSLSGMKGEIGSPLYPSYVYVACDYAWTVEVPGDLFISFTFTEIVLANHGEQCDNYVEIHDGPDESYPSKGKFCGRQSPSLPITTTSNQAYVHFVTRGYFGEKWLLEWKGVNETFIATDAPPTDQTGLTSDCGGEVLIYRNASALIHSPNYPGRYKSDDLCTWILIAPKPRHINLNFTSFNLEGWGSCYADYLEVYEGSTESTSSDWNVLSRHCSRHPNLTVSTNTSTAKLVFKTDSSVELSGFEINATAECGSILYGPAGQLSSEDALTVDPETEYCKWLILVKPGRTIKITFDVFDVPSNGLCSTQFIQLYNGGTMDSPFLGQSKYCGQNIPQVPESSSYKVIVKVQTRKYQAWETREGSPIFKLRYEEISVGCGGNLRLSNSAPAFTLSSPNYPLPPPHDIDCSWIIMSPPETIIAFNLDTLFVNTSNCHLWSDQTDYVDLFDGGTEHSTKISRICNNYTNTFHSSGNLMLVRFVIGRDTLHSLFKANVSIGSCGGTIRRDSVITSPLFPMEYQNNVECEWTFNFDNKLAMIHFETLKLQESPNCTSDYIEIRNGDSTGEVQKKLCGSSRPTFIPPLGNPNVYIKFKTDSSVTAQGFKMLVSPFYGGGPAGGRLEGCYNQLSTPTGSVVSPNYPQSVTTRDWCTWNIVGPRNRRISLTFTYFNIPADPLTGHCVQGLRFQGALLSAHSENLICGTTFPGTVESVSNELYIIFDVRMLAAGEGFQGEYHTELESYCGGDLQLPSGSFQLVPLLNAVNISSHIDCSWKIRDPEGIANRTLVLDFNSLILSNSTDNCNPSSLYVNDVYYEFWNYGICGNYSGTSLRRINPVVSVNINLYMYKSAENVLLNASYYLNECGGRVTPPAIVSSPGYPQLYPKNMDCMWYLRSYYDGQINITVVDHEFAGDCNTDYVLIRNGYHWNSPILAKYCNGDSGTDQPGNILSINNAILVEFHSSERQAKGFNLSVNLLETGCGGISHRLTDTINSPMYPQLYQPNVECVWEIVLPEFYSVNMTFQSRFDIQQSENCIKDFLLIEEKWNKEWKTVKRLCGIDQPGIITSNTHHVRITFRTDDKINGNGFYLRYKPGCVTYLTDNHGIITSPGYPDKYSDYVECHWYIQGEEGSQSSINIQFTNFTLESSYQCDLDYLAIYQGNTTDPSHLKGKYCGTEISSPMRVEDIMHLVFVTDGSVTYSGFRAEYTISGCGGTLRRSSGLFHSPNYPHEYESNLWCVWNITIPENRVIELKFITFELEESGSCSWDWVRIHDGGNVVSSPVIDRVCGTTLPPIYKSTGNTMLVAFKTDSSHELSGFQAIYRTTIGEAQGCGGLVQTTSSVIMTPGGGENGAYETDVDCVWRIIGDEDKVLSVSFDVFDLEEGSQNVTNPCPHDYVEIIDGLTSDSPLLGRFCGNQPPSSFHTSTNKLWIHFHSDGAETRRGFKLTFTSILPVCGGRLPVTPEWKTLTSPGFPSALTPGLRCYWVFDINRTKDRMEIHISDFDLPCSTGHLDLFKLQISRYYFMTPNEPYRLCGGIAFQEIFSVHNISMLLTTATTSTNPSTTGIGFKMEYRIANCSRTYTRGNGQIISPSYPIFHPEDTVCNVTVLAPEGHTISFYFMEFAIAPGRYRYEDEEDIEGIQGNRCQSFLDVYDGTNTSYPPIERLCGYSLPKPIFSTSNEMFLQLRRTSTALTNYAILYTTTDKGRGCGGSIVSPSGSFSSPFYPDIYNETSSCSWLITVPGIHTMTLSFSYFYSIPEDLCETNYLEIYEGHLEGSRERVAKYCSDYPADYSSQGNQLLVKMVTNFNNTLLKFKANFHANQISSLAKTKPIISLAPMASASPSPVLDELDLE